MPSTHHLFKRQLIDPAPRVLHAYGDELHFILTGEDTQNQFTQCFLISPPGNGPPLHLHQNEEEWFYVVKGRVSFYSDGAWTEVAPGNRVYMPKNHVHAYKNIGDEPLHMIVTTAPAGFDHFMECSAEAFREANGQAPDMDKLVQIAHDHGILYAEI